MELLTIADVRILAVEPAEARVTLAAFSRFGKGRGPPAQLTMGDCSAYALTTRQHAELLFKGNDFDATDICRSKLPG
jgi:ribonuclease VapC